MPFVQSDDVNIWWDHSGDGEAVLLLNGLSSPSDTWFRLVPQLAQRYRVLRLDNRGVGRTGAPPGPYSVPRMAQDAVAVLDAAGVDSAHVVGLSMGGLIAQELALSCPGRVNSLVLAATHPGVPHAVDGDPEIRGVLAAAAAVEGDERMDLLTPFMYAPTTSAAEIDRDNQIRATWPTSAAGFTNQIVGVSTWERRAELRSLTVPALILHGELDRVVSPAHGQLLAAEIPLAEMLLLADCGHQVFTDQEERAGQAVVSFLDRASARSVTAGASA